MDCVGRVAVGERCSLLLLDIASGGGSAGRCEILSSTGGAPDVLILAASSLPSLIIALISSFLSRLESDCC